MNDEILRPRQPAAGARSPAELAPEPAAKPEKPAEPAPPGKASAPGSSGPAAARAIADVCGTVAMGYLFIYLNINLGTLNILPGWAGYLFILRALPGLAVREPSAGLLAPLGKGLAAWNAVLWACALLGVDTAAWVILPLVAGVAGLYFHFQLLTDLADAVRPHLPEQARQLAYLRTVQALVQTVFALLPNAENMPYLAVFLLALAVCTAFALWWRLRAVKAALLELAGGEEAAGG